MEKKMGHMGHTVRVYLGDFKLGLDTGPYSLLNKINQIFSLATILGIQPRGMSMHKS